MTICQKKWPLSFALIDFLELQRDKNSRNYELFIFFVFTKIMFNPHGIIRWAELIVAKKILPLNSSYFGNVYLTRFSDRRFTSWALTKNRLIRRPYNSNSLDDIFLSVMNNNERNGCSFTQRKVFRSFMSEAFSFTYHVKIFCCHFWCDMVFALCKPIYRV